MKWTPPQVRPKDGTRLLLLSSTKQVRVGMYHAHHDVYTAPGFAYMASNKFSVWHDAVLGWMDVNDVIDNPIGYDPTFGDDRLCECGHPYYRHFDTYEDMRPVGCKYCHGYVEGLSHRAEVPLPEGTDISKFTEADWEKFHLENESICSGFMTVIAEDENGKTMRRDINLGGNATSAARWGAMLVVDALEKMQQESK